MRQIRLLILLLEPSVPSTVFSLCGAGILMIIGSWRVVRDNLFGDYLQAASLSGSAPESLSAFSHALASGPITYFFVVFVAASLVGMATYLSLGGAEKVISGMLNAAATMQGATTQSKWQKMQEATIRVGVRAAALVTWALYAVLFAQMVLPFASLAFRDGLRSLAAYGLVHVLGSFLFLMACLHLHVVFLRLVMLRPRIFGGQDVIAAGLE